MFIWGSAESLPVPDAHAGNLRCSTNRVKGISKRRGKDPAQAVLKQCWPQGPIARVVQVQYDDKSSARQQSVGQQCLQNQPPCEAAVPLGKVVGKALLGKVLVDQAPELEISSFTTSGFISFLLRA